MKEAIDKALANGFMPKFSPAWDKDTTKTIDWWWRNKAGNGWDGIYFQAKAPKAHGYGSVDYNIYQLIFSTDFVDRLIGDKETYHEYWACRRRCAELQDTENCIHCDDSECSDKDRDVNTDCPYDSSDGCSYLNSDGGVDINAAYHLQQMANPDISRDVEKLKEYIRGLV